MSVNLYGHKEQWKAPNIRVEEFKRVGRTIFIKSKRLLFPYISKISTQILKLKCCLFIILLRYFFNIIMHT